jgi:hypothetical protein
MGKHFKKDSSFFGLLNPEDTKFIRNVGELSRNNAVTHVRSPEFTGTPQKESEISLHTSSFVP